MANSHGLERAPWAAPVNDLGLVETVDAFGQGAVVAVADAANGGLDVGLGQALGIMDGDVLAAPVAVMHKAATMQRAPLDFIPHRLVLDPSAR